MAEKVWVVYHEGEVALFRHRAAAMSYLGVAYEQTAAEYIDKVRSPEARDILNRILHGKTSGDRLVNEYCLRFNEGRDMIPEFIESFYQHMEINEDPD